MLQVASELQRLARAIDAESESADEHAGEELACSVTKIVLLLMDMSHFGVPLGSSLAPAS